MARLAVWRPGLSSLRIYFISGPYISAIKTGSSKIELIKCFRRKFKLKITCHYLSSSGSFFSTYPFVVPAFRQGM